MSGERLVRLRAMLAEWHETAERNAARGFPVDPQLGIEFGDLLEEVRCRSSQVWMGLALDLSSAGREGDVLWLRFSNLGGRDSFVEAGGRQVVQTVLAERFRLAWWVQAVVPSVEGAGAGS
ncbi:hypothetical protein [Streptomyces sp. SAJ15]|uniref:hypothetical protein n=1 Tax=Streptomyces sp. SAJ15 TaxID=2011095 RepID=UPI001184F6CF|nr:hypothetical protein [Streptomyces sp. SAJ15]